MSSCKRPSSTFFPRSSLSQIAIIFLESAEVWIFTHILDLRLYRVAGAAGRAFHVEEIAFLLDLGVGLPAFRAEHELMGVLPDLDIQPGGLDLGPENEASALLDLSRGSQLLQHVFQQMVRVAAQGACNLEKIVHHGLVALHMALGFRDLKALFLEDHFREALPDLLQHLSVFHAFCERTTLYKVNAQIEIQILSKEAILAQ